MERLTPELEKVLTVVHSQIEDEDRAKAVAMAVIDYGTAVVTIATEETFAEAAASFDDAGT